MAEQGGVSAAGLVPQQEAARAAVAGLAPTPVRAGCGAVCAGRLPQLGRQGRVGRARIVVDLQAASISAALARRGGQQGGPRKARTSRQPTAQGRHLLPARVGQLLLRRPPPLPHDDPVQGRGQASAVLRLRARTALTGLSEEVLRAHKHHGLQQPRRGSRTPPAVQEAPRGYPRVLPEALVLTPQRVRGRRLQLQLDERREGSARGALAGRQPAVQAVRPGLQARQDEARGGARLDAGRAQELLARVQRRQGACRLAPVAADSGLLRWSSPSLPGAPVGQPPAASHSCTCTSASTSRR